MLYRRAGLLLLLLGCIVLPWMSFHTPVSYALARSQAIMVQKRLYVVHFPGSIDFYETVSDSASPIQRASLFLNIGPQQDQEQQNVTVAPSQQSVVLHWHEDTSGNHFLPPGAPISYYWQVWDAAGNTLTDTTQTFTTTDTRFQWQHLNRGLLQVNWYGNGSDFGQMILQHAGAALDHINSVLGSGLQRPINLWVYGSDTDFHGSLAPGSYEWVGGEALPGLNEASIVVTAPNDYTLVRDMPHELTHLVFHQLIVLGNDPPVWFDEGLAVYNQSYHEGDMLARFNEALSTHGLLRLDTLENGFPANADQAYLAYAQSWQLVTYMYKTFGPAKMASLIHNLGDATNDFDSALRKSIGEDHLHLENQWRLALHQPGVLVPDIATPTVTPTASPSSTSASTQSGGNSAIWLVAGLGTIILLEGCVLGIWFLTKKKRRAEQLTPAQPVYPMYPAYPPAGYQSPGNYPQGGWPASYQPGVGYPQGSWPPGYQQGVAYPQGTSVPGQPQPPREYAHVPVPGRVPQE